MFSTVPYELPAKEKAEWEAFRKRRLEELSQTFPNVNKECFIRKIWIEFLAFRYSFMGDVAIKGVSHLDYAHYGSIFGPDTRNFTKCYNHESIAAIPEFPEKSEHSKVPTNSVKTKKPLSLYNFFFKKKLAEYRNIDSETPSIQEASRKIGNDWRAMTYFERQKIEEEYYIEFGTEPP